MIKINKREFCLLIVLMFLISVVLFLAISVFSPCKIQPGKGTLLLSWYPPEQECPPVVGHKVYWGESYQEVMVNYEANWGKVYQGITDKIREFIQQAINNYRIYCGKSDQGIRLVNKEGKFVVVKNRNSAYLKVDRSSMPVVFVGATAYNNSGESQMPEIQYWLFGNISGTHLDGVSYQEAIVDGRDLAILESYLGQKVAWPEIDCCSDFTLVHQTFTLTLKHKCDLNLDGEINDQDMAELALRFGNTAQ